MGRKRVALSEEPVAVGYARSSGDEVDGDPRLALEAQERAIEGYAQMRGLRIVAGYRDDDVPGGVPLEARPGGAELVARMSQVQPGGLALVTLRLERLFCSARECVEYHAAWQPRGVVLHVLDVAGSAVDTTSAAGQFMLGVLESARDMEVQLDDGRARQDVEARRARGERPLLGERIVRGYIVPDPDEAQAVERIQELAGQGKSLRLIAEALDQEGVPTKRRAKAWSKEAIRLILRRIEKGEIRSLRSE